MFTAVQVTGNILKGLSLPKTTKLRDLNVEVHLFDLNIRTFCCKRTPNGTSVHLSDQPCPPDGGRLLPSYTIMGTRQSQALDTEQNSDASQDGGIPTGT